MPNTPTNMFAHWRQDIPAALVVFLVALPLCLGIAVASGAPAFSGIIAGIVGGIVVGIASKSPLSVSGPAAGLTVIVLAAIQSLPSFEAFLLAVVLAGGLQIIFGILRAGVFADFIPSSVIKGMLVAIGLILILKQLPHAVGYDVEHIGSDAFAHKDGWNTFSLLLQTLDGMSMGAVIISVVSLVFIFIWDHFQARLPGLLKLVPAPLLVVVFGVLVNEYFSVSHPEMYMDAEHLVKVPVAHSVTEFLGQFTMPDFNLVMNQDVWVVAVTIALIASIESLLCIEAVDKLDTHKRVTPTSRELVAQGAGNIASGMIGGIPITSVIVRSSANVSAGAETKLSAILHGIFLLLSVMFIPMWLAKVPLAALAAILINVGYKLTKPAIFFEKFQKGIQYFVPFIVTVAAILLTDLLQGIAYGFVVGILFVVIQNARSAIRLVVDGKNYMVRARKDLFFLHKYELRRKLDSIPEDSKVFLDLTRANYIDLDNLEIIKDFMVAAEFKNIEIVIKKERDGKPLPFLSEFEK